MITLEQDKYSGMKRRDFLISSSILTTFFAMRGFANSQNRAILSFGLMSDMHYADIKHKEGSIKFYSESCNKVRDAVEIFNQQKVDFAIELGDFKDQDPNPDKAKTLHYLKKVENEYAQFEGPRYHVLGNHDVDSLSKKEFLNIAHNSGISKKRSYYSFDLNGIHIVVLDGCFKNNGEEYDNGNFEWHDSRIDDKQTKWLIKDLKKNEHPTLIFIHQRLDEFGTHEPLHCPSNSANIRSIIETDGNTLAVFQGHQHSGDHSYSNGVHYFTHRAGVVGSYPENNSYSIVQLMENGDILINGYGNAESCTLHTR